MLYFILSFFVFLISAFSFLVSPAYAQCPICIVTVGGGMLIAKRLGIDDLLVSIWISALNTAIAFWLAPKIKIKFLNNSYLLSFIFLLFALSYFYLTDQIGPGNQVMGINKIVFGQIIGLVTMATANYGYLFIKKKNDDKTPFPYAKVVFPLILITLITIFFKLIFKL